MPPADDAAGGTDSPMPAATDGGTNRLVLVHGFTQTGRSWDAVASELALRYHVLAPDLPFHGGSVAATTSAFGEAAALLGEMAGRATYVGYSLGGRITLALALAEPELVERLVLVGASPGLADAGERSARAAGDDELAAHIEAIGLDAFLEEWLSGPLFAGLDADSANLAVRRQNTAAGLAGSLRHLGVGRQPSYWERLGELAMPVLVCAGADDAKFAAIGTAMVAAIGDNAAFELVADAGHAAPFEQPAAFVAALERFLDASAPGLTAPPPT